MPPEANIHAGQNPAPAPSPRGGGLGWGHPTGAQDKPDPHSAFHRAIEAFTPGLPITIAYSGGADSTALLAACADKWPGQVRAVHVHHGLQQAADSFEETCTDVCRRLSVALTVAAAIQRRLATETEGLQAHLSVRTEPLPSPSLSGPGTRSTCSTRRASRISSAMSTARCEWRTPPFS